MSIFLLDVSLFLSKMMSYGQENGKSAEPVNERRRNHRRPSKGLLRRKGGGRVHREAALGWEPLLPDLRQLQRLSNDEQQKPEGTPKEFQVALPRKAMQGAVHRA